MAFKQIGRLWSNRLVLTNLVRTVSTSFPPGTKIAVAAQQAENSVPEADRPNVSKAMKAYLERAKEHEEFMQEQNREYQLGKRHLANMMGEDPETFTQDDVDKAIEYLFPSGLFEKKARPFMKPPDEVFPLRKAAEFDASGRPHHFLFYTGKPNFFKMLYDIVETINEANKFEDAMLSKKKQPDPNLKLELSGYVWKDAETIGNELVETIGEKEHTQFVAALERLSRLPYAYKYKDFIMKYTKPLMSQTNSSNVPALHYDEDGRGYITTYECLRKRARAHVTIRTPGTGKISINDTDITYFGNQQSREQVRTSSL